MYFIYIVSFSFGCGKKKRIMNTKKTKKGFLIRSLVFLSMTIKKAKRAEIYVQSVWIFSSFGNWTWVCTILCVHFTAASKIKTWKRKRMEKEWVRWRWRMKIQFRLSNTSMADSNGYAVRSITSELNYVNCWQQQWHELATAEEKERKKMHTHKER